MIELKASIRISYRYRRLPQNEKVHFIASSLRSAAVHANTLYEVWLQYDTLNAQNFREPVLQSKHGLIYDILHKSIRTKFSSKVSTGRDNQWDV